jgi:hypothetical protein
MRRPCSAGTLREMPPLLVLDPARRAREKARASEVEALEREWRRAWHRVFAECLGLFLLGYILYGLAFGKYAVGRAALIAAVAMVVGYAGPFFRLVTFFVRHADQF